MGVYEQKLYTYVHSKGPKGFVRLFRGKCPQCGARIFNTNEKYENEKIMGYFTCNCGNKYKQAMYTKESKKYKFKQGLVHNYKKKGKECRGVDMTVVLGKVFLITEDKVIEINKN